MTTKAGPYDQDYFSSGPYAQVSYRKYRQYWWSNRFYAKLVLRYGPPSGRALEVGCGLGHLLARLSERYQTFGVDVNSWALEQAKAIAPNAHLALASAEDLSAIAGGMMDVVVAKHVVEHLPDPGRALAEFSRVLTEHGLLVMVTPNLESPMRMRKGDGWVGYRDPTHVSLLSPREWIGLLEGQALRVTKVFSDGFWDAPYVAWLPAAFQKLLWGFPGGMQALIGYPFLPLRWGESLIILAVKDENAER